MIGVSSLAVAILRRLGRHAVGHEMPRRLVPPEGYHYEYDFKFAGCPYRPYIGCPWRVHVRPEPGRSPDTCELAENRRECTRCDQSMSQGGWS